MWYWVFLQLPLHGRLLRHGCPGLTTEQDTAHKGTENALHRFLLDPRRGRASREAPRLSRLICDRPMCVKAILFLADRAKGAETLLKVANPSPRQGWENWPTW